MPVYKLKAEMPLQELMSWVRYFQEQSGPKEIDVTEYTPAQLGEMFNRGTG